MTCCQSDNVHEGSASTVMSFSRNVGVLAIPPRGIRIKCKAFIHKTALKRLEHRMRDTVKSAFKEPAYKELSVIRN